MVGNDNLLELMRLGTALRWRGCHSDAAERFAEAVDLAERIGDSDGLADALVWLSVVRSLALNSTDGLGEVLELQERAVAINTSTYGPSHPRVANCLRVLGRTLDELGRTDEALTQLDRASAIFRANGIRSLEAEDVLAQLASIHFRRGSYSHVVRVGCEHIPLCEYLQEPTRSMVAYVVVGQALVEMGEREDAIAHLERALELLAPKIALGGAQRFVAEIELWIEKAKQLSLTRSPT